MLVKIEYKGTRVLRRFDDTVYDESSNETTISSTNDKENSFLIKEVPIKLTNFLMNTKQSK